MKKMTKAMLMTALICGTMYCGAEPVHANELDTFALDEYVVTATRTPVKVFDANANISVITAEDIERQHYSSLQEAVRDVPGVNILDYGRAGFDLSAGLKINGSNNVVVLVDGVRVTQAGVNSFPASGFTAMENIERIEVLKGSATTLYGADAKGGVINIITKTPDETRTKLTVAAGNFSTEQYALHNEGKNGNWAYSLDLKKQIKGDFEDGNGDKVPQHLNAETIGMTVSGKFNERTDMKMSFNRYQSDFMYQDFFGDYPSGITNGEYTNEDFGVVLNHKFDDNNWNQLAIKYLEYDVFRSATDTSLFDSNVKTVAVSDQFTNKSGKNTLITGVEYHKDKIDYHSIASYGRLLI